MSAERPKRPRRPKDIIIHSTGIIVKASVVPPSEVHVFEAYVDSVGDSRVATDKERKVLEHLEALRNVRVRFTVEVFR